METNIYTIKNIKINKYYNGNAPGENIFSKDINNSIIYWSTEEPKWDIKWITGYTNFSEKDLKITKIKIVEC